MTAPKGTRAFTTEESKSSEKNTVDALGQVLLEPEFSEFERVEYYTVNEIYDSTVATNPNKNKFGIFDVSTIPDGGLLLYKGKRVGIGESKYQYTHQNACQRSAVFTQDAIQMGLSPDRVALVFDGPGFEANKEGHIGGSTGKQVVRSIALNTCLVCPTDEEEVKSFFRKFLRRIIREEDKSEQLLAAAV